MSDKKEKQNERTEEKKREKKEKPQRQRDENKEKKFYLFTAIGCAAALLAIIIVAMVATTAGKVDGGQGNVNTESVTPPSSDDNGDNKPVVSEKEEMVSPIEWVSVSNDYGFYHNQTLNSYYHHVGIDFSAAAGTEVKAAKSGRIESIYKGDILSGTEIVVDHGDGLKTVYRFVEEKEGLKVGDEVDGGEVIATVASPTGDEYKDGAHLHFEVLEKGENVDPTLHLTLEEK